MVKVRMQQPTPLPDFATILKINLSNGRDLFPLSATKFCASSQAQYYATFFEMKNAFLCPYGFTTVSINTGHTNVPARRWKNKKKVKLKILVGDTLERNVSTLSH